MEFIIKNHHKHNFTTIYNSFAQDKTLSLETRLTTNISIRTFLKEILDETTIVNLLSRKWNFKYKPPTSTDFNKEELKTHRILKGKLNYCIDYFQIGSYLKNEIQ